VVSRLNVQNLPGL